MKMIVIALATAGAGKASIDAVDDLVVRHIDLDRRVDLAAMLGQHRIQCVGLSDGAGKAIEDKPVFGVGLLDAFGDDADDDVVRHQQTLIHH